MKQKKFPIIPVLGAMLVLVSLLLLIGAQLQAHMGVVRSGNIVSKIHEVLPEKMVGVPGSYPNSHMPVMEIDGTDYVALIEIPDFGLALPVADKWDRDNLSYTPTRFSGSAYDSTFVIGGADYAGQFGFCDKIGQGAIVTVTDMTGAQFVYRVSAVDRAKHAETQWLMDNAWDLTLFCHDIFSMEYIAVRCVLAYQ